MQDLNGDLFHDPFADVASSASGLGLRHSEKSPARIRGLGNRERALRDVAKELREMQRRRDGSLITVTPLTVKNE
ncbi:hypothetical protein CQ020_14315 [Arthrobacter sp. MYb23]|nr:hypothetical protein CQ038_14830 [Arthrobacter sp. MYb51]PRB94742.1 hypothetical protein CQ020_14315 [Arthrobacter sp. MYb23]